MKTVLGVAILIALSGPSIATAQDSSIVTGPAQVQGQPQSSIKPADLSSRADLYYYFTMGHLQEQEYDLTNRSALADDAIESYKKALAIEPDSAVVRERLAEVEAQSQHIRDAVLDAQQVLKNEPDNVDAHRLLARIYVRTLGDVNAGEVQKENLDRAVEQFQDILKVKPDDESSALWLARLDRFQKQDAAAEKVLRGLLQHEPDNGPALEQLSQLLIEGGKSRQAIDLLTQAASDSSSPDVYDLLGNAYSQSKDFPKAEEAYRKAAEEDPDSPDHHRGLAQALLAEGKYAEALAQYRKLTELEPDTADNYLRVAQLDRQLGRYVDAELNLQHAKQLAPGNLEILYNEALLYEAQNRYDDAIKILNGAIEGVKKQQSDADENPNALALLYEQLGQAYAQQGNYPAEIHTYEQMKQLGPDTEKHAEFLLIDAYRDSNDIDRAIAEAKKALEASPKDEGLTVTLATLDGDKGDTAGATTLLRGLLQGNSSDQEIYLDLSQVQERGKKYADAEQSAEKADQAARAPSDKQTAWFMLGRIYESEKKYDDAEAQFRKVLGVNPDAAPVLNDYGYMLADRGVRLDEATSMIQRAVKQEPNNGAYLDSLGWAYYKQSKFAEAQEYLQKAVDLEGHDPTILGHLGDVFLKLGQDQHAEDVMERALAEWQKALPADYEPSKVSELDAQLKDVKRRLAQKSNPEALKPQ